MTSLYKFKGRDFINYTNFVRSRILILETTKNERNFASWVYKFMLE